MPGDWRGDKKLESDELVQAGGYEKIDQVQSQIVRVLSISQGIEQDRPLGS